MLGLILPLLDLLLKYIQGVHHFGELGPLVEIDRSLT